jgi:hypothetical protein
MVSTYDYKAAFIKWWIQIHSYALIASYGDGFSRWDNGENYLV